MIISHYQPITRPVNTDSLTGEGDMPSGCTVFTVNLEMFFGVSMVSYHFSSSDDVFKPSRPRQNGHHFADDTLERISVNGNIRIAIKISLKFVPKGQICNIPTLVDTMAWRPTGDKPSSGPMIITLLTHVCVTRPQWLKTANIISEITFETRCIWNMKYTSE